MHSGGNYTVVHEPGLGAQEAGTLGPLGRAAQRPRSRTSCLGQPRLASGICGAQRLYPPDPAFSLSDSFRRRPRSPEDFASSTPGFRGAEASLLQNEKRKPRPAGRGADRTRHVAAARESAGAGRAVTTRRGPRPQLPALVGRPRAHRSPDAPSHAGA